jgi:hypothetical protein
MKEGVGGKTEGQCNVTAKYRLSKCTNSRAPVRLVRLLLFFLR